MCLFPKLVENPKYKSNKKNKGIIPPMKDKRVALVAAGCGKCMECMKQKRYYWQVRLMEDIKRNPGGRMVTFTFSDQSLTKLEEEISKLTGYSGYNLDNEVAKVAQQRFSDRVKKKTGKRLRRWLITELGGNYTERIHLHGLVWADLTDQEIRDLWGYGFSHIGNQVGNNTINYITKYLVKQDFKHKEYTPRIFTSPGIGRGYIRKQTQEIHKFKGEDTIDHYRTPEGRILGLPKYYRDRLFNDEEKEFLWIGLLDKQVRYVNGVKIDVSEGQEIYDKTVERARAFNKQLGYGDDTINWDRRIYENRVRNLKKEERGKIWGK